MPFILTPKPRPIVTGAELDCILIGLHHVLCNSRITQFIFGSFYWALPCLSFLFSVPPFLSISSENWRLRWRVSKRRKSTTRTNTGEDKTNARQRQDKTTSDKTKLDMARHGKTRQHNTTDNTEQITQDNTRPPRP